MGRSLAGAKIRAPDLTKVDFSSTLIFQGARAAIRRALVFFENSRG